jgi:hypothetical protein
MSIAQTDDGKGKGLRLQLPNEVGIMLEKPP